MTARARPARPPGGGRDGPRGAEQAAERPAGWPAARAAGRSAGRTPPAGPRRWPDAGRPRRAAAGGTPRAGRPAGTASQAPAGTRPAGGPSPWTTPRRTPRRTRRAASPVRGRARRAHRGGAAAPGRPAGAGETAAGRTVAAQHLPRPCRAVPPAVRCKHPARAGTAVRCKHPARPGIRCRNWGRGPPAGAGAAAVRQAGAVAWGAAVRGAAVRGVAGVTGQAGPGRAGECLCAAPDAVIASWTGRSLCGDSAGPGMTRCAFALAGRGRRHRRPRAGGRIAGPPDLVTARRGRALRRAAGAEPSRGRSPALRAGPAGTCRRPAGTRRNTRWSAPRAGCPAGGSR